MFSILMGNGAGTLAFLVCSFYGEHKVAMLLGIPTINKWSLDLGGDFGNGVGVGLKCNKRWFSFFVYIAMSSGSILSLFIIVRYYVLYKRNVENNNNDNNNIIC